jgi:hypothetical protein
VTAALLVLLVAELRHWFVLPVVLCGALIAPDAVDWTRKRLDAFDPQAVVGLFGVHFFFLAPLLHVTLDYWPRYVPQSADWRNALGQMALLNVLGLLLYRAVVAHRQRDWRRAPLAIDVGRLLALGTFIFLLSIVGFIWVVLRFGGLAGYFSSLADNRQELAGQGLVLLAAGQFPLIAFVMVLVRYRSYLRNHPKVIAALVAGLGLMQLLAGGLGGSRSHTVWPVLVGIAMCHLVASPVRRRMLVAAFPVVLAFMYVYGFYKSAGSEALGLFTGRTSAVELSVGTGRDLPLLLLGDLGRSDIQALTLERQREDASVLGHGITYVGDLAFLVPDSVRPATPPDKVEVGTDMLYGSGAYSSGFRASQIFGLAGEAILNFGSAGAVLSFLVLGLLVRLARVVYRRAQSAEYALGSKLLAAVLPVSLILILGSDLGNLAWFLVNHVVVLAGVVFASRLMPTRLDPGYDRGGVRRFALRMRPG